MRTKRESLALERSTRIRELRAKGYTQKEIAQEVGVSQSRVQQVLSESVPHKTRGAYKVLICEVEGRLEERLSYFGKLIEQAFASWEQSKTAGNGDPCHLDEARQWMKEQWKVLEAAAMLMGMLEERKNG